ncbi:MAG: isoprenylcysteine carboxylmethyltransferase family protein [Candidatus Omnitrophica bacterium]|nr:isoprenylcysteine carboxylmethyltransferase family protein [Candidatus Omnitrophota bacterium]
MIECYAVLSMIIFYWLGALINAIKYKGSRKAVWQFKIYSRKETAVCGLWLLVYAGLAWKAACHDDLPALWTFMHTLKLFFASALFLSAMFLTQWCYRVLGAQWQVSREIPENYRLITEGPFKFLRHPIYFAQILIVAGCSVIFSDTAGWILLILFLALVRYKSKLEERSMTDQFGDAYREYKAKTLW